jgi:hypothetical protein
MQLFVLLHFCVRSKSSLQLAPFHHSAYSGCVRLIDDAFDYGFEMDVLFVLTWQSLSLLGCREVVVRESRTRKSCVRKSRGKCDPTSVAFHITCDASSFLFPTSTLDIRNQISIIITSANPILSFADAGTVYGPSGSLVYFTFDCCIKRLS